MLAVLAPGQGSQRQGFLADWLTVPGFGDRLSELADAAAVDLVAAGTTMTDAEISDTAIAQPLIVGAGLATLSVLGLGLSYWAAVRLRIANRPAAMVVSQAAVTTIVLGLALVAVPHGTVWVAAAVAVGYLAGGVVGYCVSRFWAPFHDEPASAAPRVPVAR